MGPKALLEKAKERTALAREDAALAKAKLTAFQQMWAAQMADENSPVAQGTHDIVGGLVGIGAYRGTSAFMTWLATPKPGAELGFLGKHPVVADGVQAAFAAAAYSANLLIGRGPSGAEPLGPIREIGRAAARTQLLFAIDALLVRGYRAIKAKSAAPPLPAGQQ